MKALPDDFIDALLEPTPQHTYCGTPVLSQSEIEWREEHYERADIATFPCDFCGHCPNPGQCVRSVTCPLCFRVAGNNCINPSNNAIAPYHEERWDYVKQHFGVYYK